MSKLKLISVKLDGSTLARLDDLVATQSYSSRNGLINALLSQLFVFADRSVLFALLSDYYVKDCHTPRVLKLLDANSGEVLEANPFDRLGFLRREVLTTALVEYSLKNNLPETRVLVVNEMLSQL